MSDETTLVTPVLVRDYRRLLRLFPHTYRRAHEAEMLGHLLDAAAPGQTRPSHADRADLLRAAAREWLLAPLGSTPQQRSAATRWLVVLLPLLLALPAFAGLESAPQAFMTTGSLWSAAAAPFGASWALWLVGTIALVLGGLRTARGLLAVAAAVAWVTVALLIARGEMLAVYTGVGWAVGQTACALVVAERAASERPVRWGVWKRVAVLATAGVAAVPLAAIAQALVNGSSWGGSLTLGYMIGPDTLRVPVGVLLAALACSRQARQSVPVLGGVATAVVVGRAGIFGSRTAPFYGVDLGDLLALLAATVLVTVVLRWVVNRVDELAESWALLRDGLPHAPTGGHDEVVPG